MLLCSLLDANIFIYKFTLSLIHLVIFTSNIRNNLSPTMNAARFKAMPVIETGVCRFCGHNKKCRVINIEYENLGQREVYSEMLLECFGILLSNLDRPQKERLVCASCVHRLRAACSFKNQLLKCEETLKRKIEGKLKI
ncbi:unnamed protein product [Plutella xylostella]|uniref:(diamondback moth) hypothetical protein n=1 Tax=Plutella xylostella TaxID=51655 RepID=A0A8S4DVQ3_PLUXY|nr:unnamed protein product [Plutella xylostella]